MFDITLEEKFISKSIDIKFSKKTLDLLQIFFTDEKFQNIKQIFIEKNGVLEFQTMDFIKNLLEQNKILYEDLKIIEIIIKFVYPRIHLFDTVVNNSPTRKIVYNTTTFDYIFALPIDLSLLKVNNSNKDFIFNSLSFEIEVV